MCPISLIKQLKVYTSTVHKRKMIIEILKKIQNLWNFVFYESADARIRDRILMGNPLPIIFLSILFLVFLQELNKYMQTRESGFKLGRYSLYVTVFYWIMNVYFFYEGSRRTYLNGYSWRCEPIDSSPYGVPMEVVLSSHD